MNKSSIQWVIEWFLVGFVMVVAFAVWWLTRFGGDTVSSLTVYSLFPLLGLLAFGLMWTHFVSGATRRLLGLKARRTLYWHVSSGLVLGLIILHPLLLNLGLIRDGLGLPPGSYVQAYGALAPWLLVGSVALLVFLAFELRRWYRKKAWWKYVEWAQAVAMVAIFFHALSLGRELSVQWFMAVWWTMGILLLASVVYTNYGDSEQKKGK